MKQKDACRVWRLISSTLVLVLLIGILAFPIAAADTGVDLTKNTVVVDNLKANQKSTVSESCHLARWVGEYALFDVGSGAYLLYRITVPAGEAAAVTVDFKNWTGVGNGGVHQYSSLPKVRWYVTDTVPGSFSGNTTGWTQIDANETISLNTFTYTYDLSPVEDGERTIYACMKFSDNDASHTGKAGWNDGAWVDKITFSAGEGAQDSDTPVPDTPQTGPVIDLKENVTITENLKKTHAAEYALLETGRWVDPYALYDVGVGQYLLYRIDVPQGDGVEVVVDFKNWTDVGNGGVHQYSSQPKTEWYITDHAPAVGFDGNVSGWEKIEPNEVTSLDTYTYSYTLADKGEKQPARTLYACIRFVSNASQYHGMAGGNDGAWIDAITFNRVVSKHVAVKGIALDSAELTLAFGRRTTLKATFTPTNATLRGITWASSDPSVVMVEKGELYAVGVGQATVTATTQDGGFTASCVVTVPDDMTEIVLKAGEKMDTNIIGMGDDAVTLPMSWYQDNGIRAGATSVVEWTGVTFRDFGAQAYAIYKLKVPGGFNARILMDLVINYTDANGTWNGVLSANKPRLNIFYTTDEISLSTMDAAVWVRADNDFSWSASKASYTYTVSSMSSTDRYVYVKIVSTDVNSQGAWITSLGFDTIVPTPEKMYIKAPSRTLYNVGDLLDLSGLVVGVRYDDGSETILTRDEYIVEHSGELGVTDTEIRVTTADGKLSGAFNVTVIEAIDQPGGEGADASAGRWGLIAGIGAAIVGLAGSLAAILLYRKKKQ